MNLATLLRESALKTPQHPCIRIGAHAVTYAQMDETTDRIAAGLLASGLERGDRVAVQLPNIPAFLEAYFGILKAGMVMVPLNPMLKAREIAHQLRDSAARAAITFALCAPEMAAAAELAAAPGRTIALYHVDFPATSLPPDGFAPFEALLAPPDGPPIRRGILPTAPEETAVIIYTSGTTGRPKGAELTHFQLYMNAAVASNLFGVQEEDVPLGVLPFFHIYGLSSVVNCAVLHGGTISAVARFEPGAVLDAIEEHGVSVFVGVPTMYQALLNAEIGGRDLSRLRIGSSGGAAMPEAVRAAFEEKFGIVILEGYGLSETASTAVLNQGVHDRRTGSIGKPIWGVQVEIRGEDGAALPAGPEYIGEIAISGHNVMKGYHGDPQATAAVLRDGWLRTGDLGYRDADGFFYVVDRIKDLIIRGGYNVYPREIEEVLYTDPAIAEAAVIGVPDERLGEEVVATVALRPGVEARPEELIEYCRERLAPYKYPREVHILPALPKNGTGKLLKRELREQFARHAAAAPKTGS
ncbi:long-chain fatty acid--CoA ligase [Actinospica durhamensis]|uniref:Long-chain fatty acid--CoA ligase n=1 Tax=Actinospica durhamensis TaxID=1508375 RepID=A0A941EPN9_9ACTN|nr:long-chain fatty acid--CoA ligase [Actinospica durhamensis]MBR7834277.1 long-chain fatty acid--CoA ligase [Actinospica durhamensis]